MTHAPSAVKEQDDAFACEMGSDRLQPVELLRRSSIGSTLSGVSRVFLAGVLVLVWGAPAQAEMRTVATSGEFELRARERGGRLCMTLRRERRYQGEVCGRIPRSPHRPLTMFPDVGWNNYAAAVPRSVRTAETESRRGRRARHRAFAPRGFSARFVLIPAPPSAVFVRFYGADGALLGVDGGPAGYIDLDADRTPVLGEPGESVEARTEALLAPTPDQADRLRTLACVEVTNGSGGGGFCDAESENGLVVMGACDGPDLLGGIVAPAVASVRLTLGSGAEFTVPVRELPAAFGGRRVLGAPVPSGKAVREATALDGAGQVLARTVVGTAPGGQPCAGEDQGGDYFGGPLVLISPPQGVVAVDSAGGESLLVAERAETLCVALGELSARICPPPPVDSDRPRLMRRGDTVAGALSRDAERITLQFDRGDDVTVRTTDGPAYTGMWAGDVRFFAAQVDSRREVTGAVVRNPDGAIIGMSRHGVPRRKVRRIVLAERGGLGLHLVRREGDQPCMTAFATNVPPAPRFCTDLDPGTQIDGPFLPYGGAVTVACAPRRAMAYGRFPDRFPAPRVILDGDRTIGSRRISLRGEDGWVAFLPDAAVRGLRSGKHRVPLLLPQASQQCGYSAARNF
jgi:hypothetical protein